MVMAEDGTLSSISYNGVEWLMSVTSDLQPARRGGAHSCFLHPAIDRDRRLAGRQQRTLTMNILKLALLGSLRIAFFGFVKVALCAYTLFLSDMAFAGAARGAFAQRAGGQFEDMPARWSP